MNAQNLSQAAFSRAKSAPARLDFIDGIRGAAAFWVLLGHCMIWGGWYGIPLPNPKVAVDIFMLVSGYLMFHLAEERSALEPPERAATGFNFWIRRFFRIAPAYYFVLIIVFLLSGPMRAGIETLQHANLKHWVGTQYHPFPLDYSFSSFLMHVSFLFGFSPDYASSVGLPDWSIGLEMQFYALFPLLWMVFRWLRPVGATLLIVGAWSAFKSLVPFPQFPEPSFLPLKLDLFLVGMLVASANRAFSIRPADAAAQIVIVACLAWQHSVYIWVVAAIMCVMVSVTDESEFLLFQTRRMLSPILCNRVTRFMSEMSYGVYLIHGIFISVFGGWLYSQPGILALRPVFRTLLLTAVTLACSYALAWVVNRYVEKPGIELGRRFVAGMPKMLAKSPKTLTLTGENVGS